MISRKIKSGKWGPRPKIITLLMILASFFAMAGEMIAQDYYEFSLRQRRMGDRMGVELWVKSLRSDAPNLGSFTYSVVYNTNYLSPAALTYTADETDSVDFNVDQQPDYPYREISSSFSNANGYNALMVANGVGYSELEITFAGDPATEGVQPATTGRGTFVGRLQFDIINHTTLADNELAGIIRNTTGTPNIVINDVDGNLITDITYTDPTDLTIRGISVLNPNGPNEVVNRAATYESLSVAGYPVYFERSGLVNTGAPDNLKYGTNALAYSFEYSLDGGTSWTSNTARFAEKVSPVQAAEYDNYASGEVTTISGATPGYLVTKGDGNALTSSGDGYGGVLRFIWDDDQAFSARSEQGRVRITQLATSGGASDIDDRAELDIVGMSDANFIISRLFFVQFDGTDDYFKSSMLYRNPTQLTVEAWVNLNAYGADGTEPGLVALSSGPASDKPGSWLLYLHDGKYPAFRVREIEAGPASENLDPTRGESTGSYYMGTLISPDALPLADATINLGTDANSETHRKNWVHVAATVEKNTMKLFVNGMIVAEKTNANAADIRMLTGDMYMWLGVNPDVSIEAEDYVNAGMKEARVWRTALTHEEILEHAAGVYDPAGDVVAIDATELKRTLEIYFDFQGNKNDQATEAFYQNGNNLIDFYNAGSMDNDNINFRPDKAHIMLISPQGGEGISNIEDKTFEIKWIGYGLGSTDAASKDLQIEFSRDGGSNWEFAVDNTVAPAGLPLNEVEIEGVSATWEPYNNVTESGAYHDLQGVGNTIEQNYTKETLLRVSGTTANAQDDIYDISSPFYVAPYFALKNEGDAIVYINGTTDLNISSAVTFIEAWIRPYDRPSAAEGFYPIMSKKDSVNNTTHYSFRLLSTGQLEFVLYNEDGDMLSAQSDVTKLIDDPNDVDSDSLWTHVGVLVNLANGSGESTIRFYIDGMPQMTDAITGQLGSDVATDNANLYPTFIGYEPGEAVENSRTFMGEMREVRFWNGYPAGMTYTSTESQSSPSDLTKFIQGAQAVHAKDLTIGATNYQENLVAAFAFDGNTMINNGWGKSISSTNSDINALIKNDVSLAGTGASFVSTKPYVKLVEPTFKQLVANSETALRVRWVGFDYDGVAFRSGSNALSQDADLEFSVFGGGGEAIQPWQFVSSTNYAAAYTNALSLPTTDLYRFGGVSGSSQYASSLNVSLADPDENDDEIFDDQSAIQASQLDPRLAIRARATINADIAWEEEDITSLRSEGPIFVITPPSNFSVRLLLEGMHTGSDNDIVSIGDAYDALGVKIHLYNSVAGNPSNLVATAEASGYYSHSSTLDPTTRNNDGSKFAVAPFVFTDVEDGDYFVLVEHKNHLPVMSRFPATFQFNGDDLETWAIESGWDFQAWGQNATPSSSDVITAASDDPYTGNGLYTAYGQIALNKGDAGYDRAALVFTKGQENSTSNRMAALVAGDVYRDGEINSLDRNLVRDDAGSSVTRSDVTNDGYVNALDRDLVDRNSDKLVDPTIKALIDYSVPQIPMDDKEVEKFDQMYAEYEARGNRITPLYYEKGAKVSAQAGFDYRVYATPVKNNDQLELNIYVENKGVEFAPGNCTFAVEYDAVNLEYADLMVTNDNIFSNVGAAYGMAFSSPTDKAKDPYTNVRTIEIDYDGLNRPAGVDLPYQSVKLGTIIFKIKNNVDEFMFSWHGMTKVLTTDGRDVTGDGTFDNIQPINTVRFANILSPNGGEEYSAGKFYDVTWTKPSQAAQVNVEFSDNAGNTWTKLNEAPLEVYEQSFNFKAPRVNSSQCLVRLVNIADGKEVDRSDNMFAVITEAARITRPSAEDGVYAGGSNDFIKWEVSDIMNVRFEFSENGQSEWVQVTPTVSTSTGEVAWTLPAVNTKRAAIRMIDLSSNEVIAISDEFKILAGDMTFTNPVQGDKVYIGEKHDIKWTFDNISRFDMQLSLDGGNSWDNLALSVIASDNKHQWVIPNVNSDEATIRSLWNSDPEMEYDRTPLFVIDGVISVDNQDDLGFEVLGAYPNPFVTETKFRFTLPSDELVNIVVYNATGNEVAKMVSNKQLTAGTHDVTLKAGDLPQGVYMIHIHAGIYSSVQRVVLVK